MYLMSYIMDPFSDYWTTFFTRDSLDLFFDLMSTLSVSIIICETSLILNNKLNKILEWTIFPISRFFTESILNLALSLFVNLFIFFIFFIFDEEVSSIATNYPFPLEETKGLIHWILVSFCSAFILMSIHTGKYLITNWKNEAVKTSELSRIAAEAELQALKMQIDPHFVFNNLSALSELILINQQTGHEYAERFSKIYRYTLVNSKKNLIPLKDELKFLNDYIFLIKNRVITGINFEINIPNNYLSFQLPPMTLQLLVENALKHNKTDINKPLNILIETDGEKSLIISNTINPLEYEIDSTQIGLKNIKDRYLLLSEFQPKVIQNEEKFTVIIPLL